MPPGPPLPSDGQSASAVAGKRAGEADHPRVGLGGHEAESAHHGVGVSLAREEFHADEPSPALLPRVSKIGGIRPFGFLTIRYLDPAALPEDAETFELRSFVSPKEPAWLALAEGDGAKTWAHIVEGFSKHRDRKYGVGPDGRIVRRNVLVRKSSLIGLGKEGTKLAARLKLGKAASADPSVFVDWKRRLLAMGRAEARRLGLPWNRVGAWKRTVRRTGTLRGDALRRLKAALVAPPPAEPAP